MQQGRKEEPLNDEEILKCVCLSVKWHSPLVPGSVFHLLSYFPSMNNPSFTLFKFFIFFNRLISLSLITVPLILFYSHRSVLCCSAFIILYHLQNAECGDCFREEMAGSVCEDVCVCDVIIIITVLLCLSMRGSKNDTVAQVRERKRDREAIFRVVTQCGGVNYSHKGFPEEEFRGCM